MLEPLLELPGQAAQAAAVPVLLLIRQVHRALLTLAAAAVVGDLIILTAALAVQVVPAL